jgi:histidyl-tRNA synthetase
MAEKLSAVKGMNDIFPATVPRRGDEKLPNTEMWQWFESIVRSVLHRYGYANVMTPLVEPTALFERGIGEVTDIVEKEMYTFVDDKAAEKRIDRLTLRPEATAGIVRAMIEHNALYNGPLRVWTMGAMFRREKPQKGRYRQFHQLDVEALGFPGPDVDAEQILLTRALLRELGLAEGQDVRLELNCLGSPEERLAHRAALIAYFEAHIEQLDEEARRRLHANPLRILDTKNPEMQPLVEMAPRIQQFLGSESRAHFDGLCAILDKAGLQYRINSRLVRGLDYYNLTVFEWVTDRLGSQGTVCGGGRYDGLISQLGGKAAPAVGWGLGIERLLLLLEAVGIKPPPSAPDVYIVLGTEAASAQAMVTAEALRRAQLSVVTHVRTKDGLASMKNQLGKADASGANFALVFGEDELARGVVQVKNLRDRDAERQERPLDDVGAWAATLRNA